MPRPITQASLQTPELVNAHIDLHLLAQISEAHIYTAFIMGEITTVAYMHRGTLVGRPLAYILFNAFFLAPLQRIRDILQTEGITPKVDTSLYKPRFTKRCEYNVLPAESIFVDDKVIPGVTETSADLDLRRRTAASS